MLVPGKSIVFSILALSFVTCTSTKQHPNQTIGIEAYPSAEDLYSFTEAQRKKHNLPALGIGIIHKGKILGLGMAGERAVGSNNWARVDDLFDFASCVKSMTATVAAMLVEKGQLHWNTKVTEVFPELVSVMRNDYRDVTLEMLLTHRSGLNSWMGSYETWTKWYNQYGDKSCTEQRYLFTRKVLQDSPVHKPGTAYNYCNDGYLVVASMIEKITGEPWEKYIRQQLFAPLALNSAWAGLPETTYSEKIVWGHEEGLFSRVKAVSPLYETEHGNPPFGTGSGKLYASVPDMLRYIDFHIQGSNDQGSLLQPATFTKLHSSPPDQHYALGWDVEVTRDKEGRVTERSIFHGGYNGKTRSNIWFSPESQYGTVIVYNYATGKAADAYQDIFYALLRKYELVK
jgi:CubicO group peptidase (beta-lactamase class C family)